jgi:glycosyltransferase involved in cell wall biosynthesis
MDSLKTIKYSIVIPHKNSFNKLLKLLETIPNSESYQVVIVDDNSNEIEKSKIINYSFNSNCKLIYNSISEGAGKARNIALDHTLGKWLVFADSDDLFSENIDKLLNFYYEADEDIIYFGTSSVYSGTNKLAYRHERYMKLVNDYVDDKSNYDDLKYFFTPPWSKMIRRDMVLKYKLYFEEIIASNDMLFSLKSAFFADKINANTEILYIISVSAGTLTSNFSKDYFLSKFYATLRANQFLASINKSKFQQSVLYFIAKSYHFGFLFFLKIFFTLIKNRSNLFIGLEKIFFLKKVLNEREHKNFKI